MSQHYGVSIHCPEDPTASLHGANTSSEGTTTLNFGGTTLFFEDRDDAVDWLAKAALAVANPKIIT